MLLEKKFVIVTYFMSSWPKKNHVGIRNADITIPKLIMMFIFAEKVVLTIFGDKFNESIYILKILSFVPFFISISNLYGIQAMLNLDAKKEFFYITIIGATCCIIAAFALIPIYMQNIAAMIVLSTEFIVAIASAIYVKKLFTRTT